MVAKRRQWNLLFGHTNSDFSYDSEKNTEVKGVSDELIILSFRAEMVAVVNDGCQPASQPVGRLLRQRHVASQFIMNIREACYNYYPYS